MLQIYYVKAEWSQLSPMLEGDMPLCRFTGAYSITVQSAESRGVCVLLTSI